MPTFRGPGRALALSVATLVLVAAGCGGSGPSGSSEKSLPTVTAGTAPPGTTLPATAPPTTTPPPTFGAGSTPEAAIAAYLAAGTPPREYAGSCADTQLPRDVGKWCSALQSDSTDTRIYATGPAFAGIEELLTLVRTGTVWAVTAHEPAPQPGL